MADNKIGYDLTFELNEFNQPKLKSPIELVKNVLMFILFTKPGQYPSLPALGLNIESLLYSFYDELNTEDLKKRIIEQCRALSVYFDEGSIQLVKTKYKGQPSLMIKVAGEEKYPSGYLRDTYNKSNGYLIGISFNELNQLVYNISSN